MVRVHGGARRVAVVLLLPAIAAGPLAADAAVVDAVKDRSYRVTVPLPTREHVDGGPPALHSVQFDAAAGARFLVTMNAPGVHYTERLANAARVQCQQAAWRVGSSVPPTQRQQYNERLGHAVRQTGTDALWHLLFTAPTTDRYTCRAHVKPYGYWYVSTARPESVRRQEQFLYTAETYLRVDEVGPFSRGARARSEAVVGRAVSLAATGRFSLHPAADRVQHIGQVQASHCRRYATAPGHPCDSFPSPAETRFRVRGVLVQYRPDSRPCRVLASAWTDSAVGSTSWGTRGHENVRTFLSVPQPLSARGCANRFRASTEVQRVSGGGLLVHDAETIVLG